MRGVIDCKPCSGDEIWRTRPVGKPKQKEEEDEGFIKRKEMEL
jgi:hypothetical protein